MTQVDAIILGAGIAGLTAAHDLSGDGLSTCVIETYPTVGGNHRSLNTGGMSFDIGAIFFWPQMPVFEMFPALKAGCVPVPWNTQRVSPDGSVRPYPFDIRGELLGRSPAFVARSAVSVMRSRLSGLSEGSADDFLRYYLGEEIRRVSGIDAFILRFYGRPASEISFAFAQERMQQIARGTQIRTRLGDLWNGLGRRLSPRTGAGPVALARTPAGFAEHYAPAVRQLEAQGVRFILDAGDAPIIRSARGFTVETPEGAVRAPRLISTIPMELAAARLGLSVDAPPKSLSLTTLCCRFEGQRGFDGTILYNFNQSGRWKRLTMHSDYYGRTPDGAEYFCVETVANRQDAPSPATQFDDFKGFAAAHGLFRGQLTHVDTVETGYAYPLYERGVEARRDRLVTVLSDQGVELMGRQGRFQYHPTSGNTVLDVRAALARARTETAA